MIAAGLQAVATALAGVLYMRTRKLYRQRALEVHSADLVEAVAPSAPQSPRTSHA